MMILLLALQVSSARWSLNDFCHEGDELVLLSRKPRSRGSRSEHKVAISLEPGESGGWGKSLSMEPDGIVNLAGEGIAEKRWTERQKEIIRSSRIDSTRALVHAIAKAESEARFLLNASAVGYYGARGDETLTEESTPGKDYLARVCIAWEEEARKAQDQGVRVALVKNRHCIGQRQGRLSQDGSAFQIFRRGTLGIGQTVDALDSYRRRDRLDSFLDRKCKCSR